MNKPLIVAGAAFSAAGLLTATPAQAGTLTFGFDVDSSLEVTVNPLLAGNTLGGVTVPNQLTVTADDVAGSFTVLDDPAQFTDGSLELDYGFISDAVLSSAYSAMVESLLGDYGVDTEQVLQTADNLFEIDQFQGSGVLTSKDFTLLGNPSPINISYADQTVVIDGYDTAVAESCLSTTCLIDGSISYGVSLVISEFITLTSGLLTNPSLSLSQEESAAIANLQQMAQLAQFFGPNLSLATVAVDSFAATTDPIGADPAGSELSATVTDGVITATTLTGTQEEQLFSTSLAPAAPTVDAVGPSAVSAPLPVVPASTALSVKAVTSEPQPLTNLKTGGSVAPTGSISLSGGPVASSAQAVPEPSILVGLLGTAALIRRGRKKTAA